MKKLLVVVLLLGLISVSCGSYQTSDQGYTIEKKIDGNIYELLMEADSLTSHENFYTEGSAVAVNGFGSGSVSAWTDGKGILRGKLLRVEPSLDGFNINSIIIVKTTDLKIKMVKDGDVIRLVCVADYEPVVAEMTNQGSDEVSQNIYDIWELDYCRLLTIESVAQ